MATTFISLNEFGAIINLSGILVPTALSLTISAFYPQPFFRLWTLSLVVTAIAMVLVGVAQKMGFPWYLMAPAIITYSVHAHLLFQTAFTMTGRPVPKGVWALLGLVMLAGLALMAPGRPGTEATLVMTLYTFAAHSVLGRTLIRWYEGGLRRTRVPLGVLVILAGLWMMTYPLMAQLGLLGVGYIVAGFLYLAIGIGMVVFLLEHTAENLRLQNERLKATDRLNLDFLATLSHELRTPLTMIKGTSSALVHGMAGPVSDPQYELLLQVETNSNMLVRLVDDLLDFSKFESNSVHYDMRPVDVRQIVKQAVNMHRNEAEQKQLEVVPELPDRVTFVQADTARMVQALSNLVSNAIKFTPGPGVIHVRVTSDGRSAAIAVADPGIGIAPDQHEKIFEKFYQVDQTMARQFTGSGLGLAIVRHIVQNGHGGDIQVTSQLNEGSTFTVVLPLLEPDRLSERHTG